MKLHKIREQYKENIIDKAEYIEMMHKEHSLLFQYSSFIKNKDIKKIEITDDNVFMTSREHGVKILCDKDDHRIVPVEILNFDHYEKENSQMIFNLVKDNNVIFDVGANIGWYSLCLSKVKRNLRTYAFEPIPKTYEYLKQNIKLNGYENIKTFNHGLSNQSGEIEFYYYPEGSGNSSLANLSENHKSVKVKSFVKRMDDLVEEESIDCIDFIKCDVEGAELLVFQGGEKSIKKFKPIVFTEMLRKWSVEFKYNPNEIINFYYDLGYKCYTVAENKLIKFEKMDKDTVETNFFFLHNSKHAREIEEFVVI